MKISKKLTILAIALSAMSFASIAAEQLQATTALALKQQALLEHGMPAGAIVSQRIIPFSKLGYNRSLTIQGSEANAYVGFGSRLDEVVSKAILHFEVTPSPSLLATVSHLKVYLNNELMGVMAINEGQQGKKIKLSVPLDTRYFSDYNQLRFELIGNTKKLCSNPNDASIWAEISQNSHIDLSVQKIRLASDLSLFPAPFFDERDFSLLHLPIVMGSHYNLEEMRAAGILSSYFGGLSDWRGAKFPLDINQLPNENSIVFITNDNKPEFLKDFPMIDGPRVQVITHPTNPYVKLLLIMGRNSQDLSTAVAGIALGNQLLTGSVAIINKTQNLQPRRPYDAPKWLSTEKPILFSELVDQPSMLQTEGRVPSPISVHMSLPPDLFTWHTRGIPMDLNYRYSPPTMKHSGSRMTLSINDQFVKAFNLTPSGHNDDSNRVRIPLLDDSLLNADQMITTPAFKVGSENKVNFTFGFAAVTDGECIVAQASKQYAAIDGDSTIDFSGFPHYIKMPNMRAFATSGFPYTRMADLSETAVVVPKHASKEVFQTFLNTMGKFGSDTGYPAIRVTLTDHWQDSVLEDKDILTIGVAPELKNAESSPEQVNLVLQAGERHLRLPNRNEVPNVSALDDASNSDQDPADYVSIKASGAFAAITGMASPFSSQRSIVSIMAAHPTDFALVSQALTDSGKQAFMFGTVVTLRNGDVASYNVGEHYYVGELPVWQLIWYHFSNHPFLIAFFAALLVVIVTIVLWRVLRQISANRLADMEDNQ